VRCDRITFAFNFIHLISPTDIRDGVHHKRLSEDEEKNTTAVYECTRVCVTTSARDINGLEKTNGVVRVMFFHRARSSNGISPDRSRIRRAVYTTRTLKTLCHRRIAYYETLKPNDSIPPRSISHGDLCIRFLFFLSYPVDYAAQKCSSRRRRFENIVRLCVFFVCLVRTRVSMREKKNPELLLRAFFARHSTVRTCKFLFPLLILRYVSSDKIVFTVIVRFPRAVKRFILSYISDDRGDIQCTNNTKRNP